MLMRRMTLMIMLLMMMTTATTMMMMMMVMVMMMMKMMMVRERWWGAGRWWSWGGWCWGGRPIPRPWSTLCASLRSQMHTDMSEEAFCAENYRKNAGRFRYHLDWTPALTTSGKNPFGVATLLGELITISFKIKINIYITIRNGL